MKIQLCIILYGIGFAQAQLSMRAYINDTFVQIYNLSNKIRYELQDISFLIINCICIIPYYIYIYLNQNLIVVPCKMMSQMIRTFIIYSSAMLCGKLYDSTKTGSNRSTFLQYFKQEISIFYNTRDALWVINAI